VVSDARNYMAELLEYGQKRHGAKVQIDVELNGREVHFSLASDPNKVVEHATFEDLAKTGVLPDIPPFKWNDGGSAP